MTKSSISIDLDDPRTGLVAEALSNKTCVKILTLLAEKELTASDIAGNLNIPLNTTGYNLDKLIASGLIEKSSNFFWSVKGKKTPVYKVADRRIVISPKRVIKGIVPAVIASGVFALILRSVYNVDSSSNNLALQKTFDSGPEIAVAVAQNLPQSTSLVGVASWFFMGAIFSLIILFLWNWTSGRRL